MGQIFVEFDNKLTQSEIIIPLYRSSKAESGEFYKENKVDIQQTLVYGIQAPLIQINNIVIDYQNVIEFSLKSINELPEVTIIVNDSTGLLNTLDTTNSDNELRVQILPRFDEAYKKINLTFYLSNIKINGNYIQARGIYKISKLTSTQFKSFGEISTYNLFKTIASETELGFATNIKNDDSDKRYIYCPYKSYKYLLDKEVTKGGGQDKIYDYWVDFWNNINLVDIYDRYNSIDKESEMQIWVASQLNDMGEGDKITPHQTLALLTNLPTDYASELYVKNYLIHNNTGIITTNGTDRIFSFYKENDKNYTDVFVQDGDIKKDIFIKYDYLGELYGEYNYLLQPKLREAFMQKITSETIEVTLQSPLLGLMRGSKVNFGWYINDDSLKEKIETLDEIGLINDVQLSIQIPDEFKDINAVGGFVLDKKISGQYLIIGTKIIFSNGEWRYVLILSRPAKYKPKLINDGENG